MQGPIDLPEAPRLGEDELEIAPWSDTVSGRPCHPEMAKSDPPGTFLPDDCAEDASRVVLAAYDDNAAPTDLLGGDVTSSPVELPANPLRRDGQGFVVPEDRPVEHEGPSARASVGATEPVAEVRTPDLADPNGALQAEESRPSAMRTAMRPQSIDRLPVHENNAIHEILRKESVLAVDSSAAKAVEAAGPHLAWKDPKTLLDALEKLAREKTTRAWAELALKLTTEFGQEMSQGSAQAKATLVKLEEVAAEAGALAARLENQTTARRVRQAGFALSRRLDIWRELPPVAEATSGGPAAALDSLKASLAQFDALTADSREGTAWRQYLLTDALREELAKPNAQEGVRRIAQESLRRFGRGAMSDAQRRFLAHPTVAALRKDMARLTREPVDLNAILASLEQYEQTLAPSDARRLAETCQALDFPLDANQERLDRCLDTHYRNANLRLAVAEKLLNRLMPQRATETAPVYDTVMGMDVYGESITTSRLAVRLLPSPDRVRMALEVTGTVNSFTTSSSGPATFHNNGTAVYLARKPMEVDLRGIRMEPTQIDVHNDIRLQNLETNFDGVPLVSPLVKGIAQRKYEESRPEAAREMRGKVAATARQRIDTETNARLQQFAANFNKNILHPLNTLDLQPSVVAAETTPDRFLMRLRLAGDDQLGSHTPRPQAPSDSLASVQVHESALNNALMRLELDGKTFSLPELSQHIAKKFENLDALEVNPDNEDVYIEFAACDALQVHCDEGQVALTLAVAKLSKGSRAWRDFQVRAFYKPVVEGRKAELVRDGVIHLSGKRLSVGSQIALRGIFARTFSRKTPWVLTPDAVMKNAALADQAITQFTIDDGWIGAALGPKPIITTRPAILRK